MVSEVGVVIGYLAQVVSDKNLTGPARRFGTGGPRDGPSMDSNKAHGVR